jgi:hypothetical protein
MAGRRRRRKNAPKGGRGAENEFNFSVAWFPCQVSQLVAIQDAPPHAPSLKDVTVKSD